MQLKKYLITDPKYYGSDLENFVQNLEASIKINKPDLICYRDKNNKNYNLFAKKFVEIAQKLEVKNIFLHSDFELARKLNADGVHLTSQQLNQITDAKKLDLKVIFSSHSFDEVQKAENLNSDFVTFSPIFETPNKGEPLGIKKLQKLTSDFASKKIKIIALGGIISQKEVQKLEKVSELYGFASIRYFAKFDN
jgi:thiamine-phosphate pyrophosphorylase